MNENHEINTNLVDVLYERLDHEAEAAGYHLNPDEDFTSDLIEGLLINEKRYGYRACPCRLATGRRDEDLDIICPCDYRDADLLDWGACYCALYVSEEAQNGEKSVSSIPERRPPRGERSQLHRESMVTYAGPPGGLPVFRCRVCGYLCAREHPPAVCPICKATRDRFERFW